MYEKLKLVVEEVGWVYCKVYVDSLEFMMVNVGVMFGLLFNGYVMGSYNLVSWILIG